MLSRIRLDPLHRVWDPSKTTWTILAAHVGGAVVRAEPFDAIELELSALWVETVWPGPGGFSPPGFVNEKRCVGVWSVAFSLQRFHVVQQSSGGHGADRRCEGEALPPRMDDVQVGQREVRER